MQINLLEWEFPKKRPKDAAKFRFRGIWGMLLNLNSNISNEASSIAFVFDIKNVRFLRPIQPLELVYVDVSRHANPISSPWREGLLRRNKETIAWWHLIPTPWRFNHFMWPGKWVTTVEIPCSCWYAVDTPKHISLFIFKSPLPTNAMCGTQVHTPMSFHLYHKVCEWSFTSPKERQFKGKFQKWFFSM